MKRVVFINQDSGYLMIDLINTYVGAGYPSTLVTGRLVVRNTPLHPSVNVEKIIRYNRVTAIKRLFTWSTGFLQIWLKVIFKYRNSYLFIVSNPPLAPLLPVLVSNPFSLLIFDIYPDVLSELGYLSKSSKIIKWWEKINRKVFAKAEKIFTITDGMKQVLEKYSLNKPVDVISVWTDNTFLQPIDPADNPFIRKYGLTGKFIVLYSGNLGLSGDVDVLVDVADVTRREDILFLIIGEGSRKERMQERVRSMNLVNVTFLPWQPVEELTYSLSSASLAVVSLGKGTSRLAIPSKLYNYLSVGAPLLCISSRGSEVENLVTSYMCGRNFEPTEITRIAEFIIEIYENRVLHQQMRENSLKASTFFSSDNLAKLLVK